MSLQVRTDCSNPGFERPRNFCSHGFTSDQRHSLVDVDALISDKLFGVWNDLLIVIHERRVSVPPVVLQFINLP